MGSASPPAVDSRKMAVGTEVGTLIMDVLQRGLLPREILTREAFENAMVCAMKQHTSCALESAELHGKEY